ncbi:MAG: hypothetical protein PHD76_15065 [Methylacidiphilales bacterium]|nr:hypothetical protein [Candidatus Methylacidiphilales bacterium]
MPTLLLALGLFSFFNTSAHADPLVKFPEGNAAWIVEITYPSSQNNTQDPGAAQPPQTPASIRKPQKIEVSQSENVRRIRITWTKGPVTEQWTIPNLPVVFKEYPSGDVFPLQNNSNEALNDKFDMPGDLPAFAWITPALLKEKDPVSYKSHLCYHYVGSLSRPVPQSGRPGPAQGSNGKPALPPPPPPTLVENREAWIEIKTLFPVVLNTGSSLCTFTLLPAPDGPLDMPENFKKEIAYYKHVMGYP